jgi:ABC-2 type transport system ATP-binding protein
MTRAMVEISGLTKSFPVRAGWRSILGGGDRRTVLKSVNLRIEQGEVFGLLGPNGAGKTTLIKILSGLVSPGGGTIRVDGLDVAKNTVEVRRRIGLVHGDERSFFWRLSLRENLRFYSTLYRIPRSLSEPRIVELAELLGLGDALDREMHSFSSGMRQRAALARGLIHDPALIVLDEPTRSLDPIGAEDVRMIVADRVAAGGRTVLIATHLMIEAESLCDRLVLIDSGFEVFTGTVSQLRALLGNDLRYVISLRSPTADLHRDLRMLPGVLRMESSLRSDGEVELDMTLAGDTTALGQVIRRLVERGSQISSCVLNEPTLEEAFRTVIQRRRISEAAAATT